MLDTYEKSILKGILLQTIKDYKERARQCLLCGDEFGADTHFYNIKRIEIILEKLQVDI